MYPTGYPAGPATEDKKLGTSGQPNGEGEEIIEPRAAPSSPWTELDDVCTVHSPTIKKIISHKNIVN